MGQGQEARYYLKSSGGYVAVYSDPACRRQLRLTDIETALLRRRDRELLERGIPAPDRRALLLLLEDLGS